MNDPNSSVNLPVPCTVCEFCSGSGFLDSDPNTSHGQALKPEPEGAKAGAVRGAGQLVETCLCCQHDAKTRAYGPVYRRYTLNKGLYIIPSDLDSLMRVLILPLKGCVSKFGTHGLFGPPLICGILDLLKFNLTNLQSLFTIRSSMLCSASH